MFTPVGVRARFEPQKMPGLARGNLGCSGHNGTDLSPVSGGALTQSELPSGYTLAEPSADRPMITGTDRTVRTWVFGIMHR